MKLPASQALFTYWSSLCQGRRAPERKALDPAAMRHVLAHTFMLEVDATQRHDCRLLLRLSGTRLDALFKRDLAGSAFLDLWAEPDQALIRSVVSDIFLEALPAIVGGDAGPARYLRLPFEMLLLPLRHEGRTHSRLLGSMALSGTPSWLGLQPTTGLEATSWRLMDGDGAGQTDLAAGVVARNDRRGHLIVHQGGRTDLPAQTVPVQDRVKPAMSRWTDHR